MSHFDFSLVFNITTILYVPYSSRNTFLLTPLYLENMCHERKCCVREKAGVHLGAIDTSHVVVLNPHKSLSNISRFQACHHELVFHQLYLFGFLVAVSTETVNGYNLPKLLKSDSTVGVRRRRRYILYEYAVYKFGRRSESCSEPLT